MRLAPKFRTDCDQIAANCALFATRRLARSLSRLFDRRLSPTGLKGTQYNLLVAIARGAGTSLSQLGTLLGMDRSNVSHALKPLLRQRLVRMAANKDRRSRTVQLTALGRRRIAAAIPYWREAQLAVEQAVAANATPKQHPAVGSRKLEWGDFNRDLRRLNRRLSETSGATFRRRA